MTLEELLREAAAKGLTHVTMWPVESQDRKTIYWYCRATPSTGHSYVQTQSTDPVEALSEVLKALPKAPKRTAKVTAPVTDPGDALHQEHMRDIDATINPQPPTESMDTWLPKA